MSESSDNVWVRAPVNIKLELSRPGSSEAPAEYMQQALEKAYIAKQAGASESEVLAILNQATQEWKAIEARAAETDR